MHGLFARCSALGLVLFLSLGLAHAVAMVYVDDNYSAIGTNDGHAWGVDAFASITAGVAAVDAGGTVQVAAGTYVENVTIGKALTLQGAGNSSTFLTSNAGTTLTITTGGSSASDPLVVRDLHVTCTPGPTTPTILLTGTIDNLIMANVSATNGLFGMVFDNNTVVTNMDISGCGFDNNEKMGIQIGPYFASYSNTTDHL